MNPFQKRQKKVRKIIAGEYHLRTIVSPSIDRSKLKSFGLLVGSLSTPGTEGMAKLKTLLQLPHLATLPARSTSDIGISFPHAEQCIFT
jgi:hypothetical protein